VLAASTVANTSNIAFILMSRVTVNATDAAVPNRFVSDIEAP
jgi:hypothetical protein